MKVASVLEVDSLFSFRHVNYLSELTSVIIESKWVFLPYTCNSVIVARRACDVS